MNLALFDFDGTISDRDSFLLFVRHTVGGARFAAGMAILAPRVLRFLCGRYPNHRLKEDVLTRFFRNWSVQDFCRAAEEFSRQRIPAIIRPAAGQRLAWHRRQGDRIVIVSATPELILAPWCRRNDLELIATRLEVVDDRLTGRISGRNCRGPEKVARINSFCTPADYDEIYAYGDTDGDRPMLAMAHRPSFRPFH